MSIFHRLQLRAELLISNIDGLYNFPGNLFAVLIYYCDMGDVVFGMIVGYTVLVNCTGDMTAVLFDSILYTLAGLTYVGEVAIFSWTGPFVDQIWSCAEGLFAISLFIYRLTGKLVQLWCNFGTWVHECVRHLKMKLLFENLYM